MPEEMIRDWWAGRVSGWLDTELSWKTRTIEKSRCVRHGEGRVDREDTGEWEWGPFSRTGRLDHEQLMSMMRGIEITSIRNLGVGQKVLTSKTVSRMGWAQSLGSDSRNTQEEHRKKPTLLFGPQGCFLKWSWQIPK